MSKSSAFRRMSERQLYPLAFNFSKNPTSWVSLKNEETEQRNDAADYLIVQKPKCALNGSVTQYLNVQFAIWEIVVAASILLNTFMVTVTYIFVKPKSILNEYFYVILACDLIYSFDLGLGFAVRFNPKLKYYSLGRCRSLIEIFFDFFLVLQTVTFYTILIKDVSNVLFLTTRLPVLLRLYKLPLLLAEYENVVSNRKWILFITKFSIYYMVLQHLCACVWYLLVTETSPNSINWSSTIANESYYPKTQNQWYLISAYYANSIVFNCGFGDIAPIKSIERYVSGAIMLIGQFFWVFYVSAIAIIFIKKNTKYFFISKRFELLIRQLNLMKSNSELTKKLNGYLKIFLFKKSGTLDTTKLTYVPSDILSYMNFRATYRLLQSSIVFKNKPESFLRHVCSMVKHEFYLEGQDIYTKHKNKDKMVIIRSGIVNILSEEDHESPVMTLGPKTCLAESALILCIPAKVTVRAASFVDLQTIHTKDFIRCSLTHPDFFIEIRDMITKRLTKSLSVDVNRSNVLKTLKNVLNEQIQSKEMVMKFLGLYNIQRPKPKRDAFEIMNSAWIQNGDSFLMFFWEIFVVLCAIIVAIFHPYFAVFKRGYPEWYGNVSTAIHVIFIIDIVVTLTTAIELKNQVINKLTGILSYQLDRFGFTLDVISAFYLEVYAPLTPNRMRFRSVLKLNRLLKIYKFFDFFEKLERKRTIGSLTNCCIKTSGMVFLLVYWSGMVLYLSTCFYESCTPDGWYLKKLKENVKTRILTTSAHGKFVLSLIYGLSVSMSIGIGDVLPKNQTDLILVIIAIVLGKTIYGYCLAELISLTTLKLNAINRFEEYLSALQFYVTKRSIPEKLQQRISNYLKVQWQCNEAHSILSNKPLNGDLTRIIKNDLRREECHSTMNKFIVFNDLGSDFITYLTKTARIVVLGPSEIVSYFGSINREMYIISQGYCLQQTESNIYKTIGPGTAIGFSSLLFGLPSMNNTYTATHCVLVYINVTAFNNALRHSPSLFKMVYKARQRVLVKYNANYEIRMIENPHYTRMRANFRIKCKRFNDKLVSKKSFINTYKYCMYNKESYGKLSNESKRICFLKYLLMPIVILPNGPFMTSWQTIRFATSLITFVLIPISYALSPYKHELHYFLLITDIIAYVDMYVMMHLSYYGKCNQMVIHPWSTAENYLKGSFILDAIVWFPYSGFIQAAIRGHDEGHSKISHMYSPHILHCSVCLVKMLDFHRVISAVTFFSRKYQTNQILHCAKYVFYSMIIIHIWTVIIMVDTCEYKHVSELSNWFTKDNITYLPDTIPIEANDFNYYCSDNSWLNMSSYRKYTHVWQVYMLSAYWVTQYFTRIAFGDIYSQNLKETYFAVFIMITGIVFYTYVIADIVSRSGKKNFKLLENEKKFLYLLHYLKNEKINFSLLSKVIDHFQYHWGRTLGYEINDILSKMNCTLQEDTLLHLYEGTLRHVPLFENLDHAFFRVFGKELREEYFMEGDVVLSRNDVVRDIYIIHKGAVELSGQPNMVPVIMGIGGIFGNIFDKHVSLCGISVRALKNLDVLRLNVEAFRKLLKDYPFIQKKIGIFPNSENQRFYAIPSSFVDEGNTYVNTNLFWNSRNSPTPNSKKSLLSFCKSSVTYQSALFDFFTILILITAYYNCLITTYQFSFQHFSGSLLITTVIIDVVFLLKFCLEINSPYSPDANSNKCFFGKWTKTTDFFANLPFSYTVLFVPFVSDTNAQFYFSTLRLITLLRMIYIYQFFSYYRRKLMYNRSLLELCNLVVFSTLIIHLLTCLWYISVCPFRKCSNENFMPNINKTYSQELYAASLYLIIDILTDTGTGNILPQTYSQMVVILLYMLLANIFLGYIIAQLITALRSNNFSIVKLEYMLSEIKNYYVNAGVKRSKAKYLYGYFKLLWKKHRGIQDYEMLKILPSSIRMEIADSIFGKLLKDSYIFCQTERDFLRQLGLFLRPRTYFPGNYIVRDGDVDGTMYFIQRGDVEILTVNLSTKETVHEVLRGSEVFGIVQGLFKELPHHFSFRALTVVDVAELRLADWEPLLDLFPKSKDVIYRRVEEIYYTI